MFTRSAASGLSPASGCVSRRHSERGSLLIASVFMLFFLFLVAGLAVDASRYYLYEENAQNVADGAARAGARALSQYHYNDKIDEQKVHQAVIDYIRANQGDEYADLYKAEQDGEVDGIHVAKFGARNTDQCVDFSINEGSVQLNQPADLETEVLGAALNTSDADEDQWPITSRIEITRNDGSETHTDPWGDFGDPSEGNLSLPNGADEPDPANLHDLPPEWEVDVRAKSWDHPGDGPGDATSIPGVPVNSPHSLEKKMDVTTGEDEAFTFTDGDEAPDFKGYGNQKDADDFIKPYMTPDGEITLQDNQAIVFFELFTDDPNAPQGYDKQDLVVLLTMTPTGGSGGGGVRGGSPPWITPDGSPCGGAPRYRVGVKSFENFEPMFLPESVFGQENRGIVRNAVAEVNPQFVRQHGTFGLECTVYSGGTLNFNNLNARIEGNTCASGNVNFNNPGSNHSRVKKLIRSNGINFTPPQGVTVDEESTFGHSPGSRPVPSVKADFAGNSPDLTNYTVDMQNGSYMGNWNDGAPDQCQDDNGPGQPQFDREMRTKNGNNVVWEENGNPVCVSRIGGTLRIQGRGGPTTSGQIGTPNNPVTIFTNRNVNVDPQITLHGALVSTQNITLNGGGHVFKGADRNNLGGLTLWAGGNLNIGSGSTFEGIVGAEGNVTFGTQPPPTPQPGSGLEGLLIAGGTLRINGSSQATLIPGPDKYDADLVLDSTGWNARQVQAMGDRIPPFSEAQVKMIPTPEDVNSLGGGPGGGHP